MAAIRLVRLAFHGENIFRPKSLRVDSEKDHVAAFKKRYFGFCYQCGVIVDHPMYSNVMIFVISFTGILAGMACSTNQSPAYLATLDSLGWLIQAIFTLDCLLKFLAEYRRFWYYFYDAWNLFDFFVVFVSYLSSANMISFNPIFLRLLRLFRVLKLLKQFKQLQVIISAISGCTLSVVIVGIFIFTYLSIYAAIGMSLFGENDPLHFGNMYVGVIAIFQSVTYDNWSGIMYVGLYGCEAFEYAGTVDWAA